LGSQETGFLHVTKQKMILKKTQRCFDTEFPHVLKKKGQQHLRPSQYNFCLSLFVFSFISLPFFYFEKKETGRQTSPQRYKGTTDVVFV